jgi:hypothetical protein
MGKCFYKIPKKPKNTEGAIMIHLNCIVYGHLVKWVKYFFRILKKRKNTEGPIMIHLSCIDLWSFGQMGKIFL